MQVVGRDEDFVLAEVDEFLSITAQLIPPV